MSDSVSRPIIASREWDLLEVDLIVRVQQLYVQYAWAVDYGDFDLLNALVVPEVSITRGEVTYHGLAEFLKVYENNWDADWSAGKHYISNVTATRNSESGITARAYFQAIFIRSNRTTMVVGRYEDSLVDNDGQLQIAHKRIYVEGSLDLPEVSRDWNGYQFAKVK